MRKTDRAEVINRLHQAIATAIDDDTSAPQTALRARHEQRLAAMRAACSRLAGVDTAAGDGPEGVSDKSARTAVGIVDDVWKGAAAMGMACLVLASPFTAVLGLPYSEPAQWTAAGVGAALGAALGARARLR